MVSWQEAIEDAKHELGIVGWTDNWSSVVALAKQKYWHGDEFNTLSRWLK